MCSRPDVHTDAAYVREGLCHHRWAVGEPSQLSSSLPLPCRSSAHLSLPGFSFGLPQRGDGTHWEGLLGACELSVVSPTTGLHLVFYTMARERDAELLY